MFWKLTRRLKRIGASANPDPVFVRSLEQVFRSRMQPSVSSWRTWRVALTSFCSVGLVLTGATGVYAYHSDEVIPGHPLYGVRTTIERAEVRLAVTSEKQTQVQLKQLRRRLREQVLMQRRQIPTTPKNAETFDRQLERTMDHVTELPEQEQEKVIEETANIERSYRGVLRDARAKAATSDRTTIDQVLEQHERRLDARIQKQEERQKAKQKPSRNERMIERIKQTRIKQP